MMDKMMRAYLLQDYNDLRFSEVPVPKPGEFEVLCRVESVKICGSDPHIIKGDYRDMRFPSKFPHVLGHEWSGVIVELGDKSEEFGWKAGDRVAGTGHAGCGYCSYCMEGRYTLCSNNGNTRIHSQYGCTVNGACAQYMVTSLKSIIKIPDDMNFDLAACLEAVSIALHGVMHSKIEPGDKVFINGTGPLGLLAILCARHLGADTIIACDTGYRLEIAKTLGAVPIDFMQNDVQQAVMQQTYGKGAKRVIECSGTSAGIVTTCNIVASGGCVSLIGVPEKNVELSMKRLIMNEIEIVGNRANPNTFGKSVSLAVKYQREIEKLITHIFPLKEYQKAIEIFEKKADGAINVIIRAQE